MSSFSLRTAALGLLFAIAPAVTVFERSPVEVTTLAEEPLEEAMGGIMGGLKALSKSLGIPAATLSFHLKELKNAQLVSAERNGRSLVYRADYQTMTDVIAYLGENCCQAQGCSPA